jgi:hypothetical protein
MELVVSLYFQYITPVLMYLIVVKHGHYRMSTCKHLLKEMWKIFGPVQHTRKWIIIYIIYNIYNMNFIDYRNINGY